MEKDHNAYNGSFNHPLCFSFLHKRQQHKTQQTIKYLTIKI